MGHRKFKGLTLQSSINLYPRSISQNEPVQML